MLYAVTGLSSVRYRMASATWFDLIRSASAKSAKVRDTRRILPYARAVNPNWEIVEWNRIERHKVGVSLFREDPQRQDLTGSFAIQLESNLEAFTPEMLMNKLRCDDELRDTDRLIEKTGGCSQESLGELVCVRLNYSSVDLKVKWALGERYLLKGWDLYCLNPLYKDLVLKISFSQRSAEKEKPVFLQSEIEKTLESLTLDPIWK